MVIPHYPESRPLEFDDKALLDGIFASLQPRISEFTFANLYLFREAHAYRLTRVGDSVAILGRGYDGSPYFLPPLPKGEEDALATLFGAGLTLYGADEAFVAKYSLEKVGEIVADRDSFDYLYLMRELAELPGNRFHKKKNRINYFTSRHSWQVELYSDRHRDECLELLAEWLRVKSDFGGASLRFETTAAAEALRLAAPLGLQGVVTLIEGKVRGVVLGERLNDDTVVCHFEKADPFIEGLYQLADREFCRLLFTDCAYVNREQDLGEPSLRKSKLSYHPVELVKKFRVRRFPD